MPQTQPIKSSLQRKINIPPLTTLEAQQRLKPQSQPSPIPKTYQLQNQGASSSPSAILKRVAATKPLSPPPNLTHKLNPHPESRQLSTPQNHHPGSPRQTSPRSRPSCQQHPWSNQGQPCLIAHNTSDPPARLSRPSTILYTIKLPAVAKRSSLKPPRVSYQCQPKQWWGVSGCWGTAAACEPPPQAHP